MSRLKNLPFYVPGTPPKSLMNIDYLEELEATWRRPWGAQSNIKKLQMVLVHRPGPENEEPEIFEDPAFFNLCEGFPEIKKMQEQHDNFVKILRDNGVEVVYLDPEPPLVGTFGIPLRALTYARASIVINGGAIIDRHASHYKRGMEFFFAKRLLQLGCPILYTVHRTGVWEASNVVWLDSEHVVIGVGLRTNEEGIRQVRPIFEMAGVKEIFVTQLPGHFSNRKYQVGGAAGFFHLDMTFGMADEGIAVIYPGGVGYPLIEYLEKRGIDLIEIPENEVINDAANILALEPGKVIIPAGSPKTSQALREKGIKVIEVDMSEFVKGGGGSSCITLPLIRR